MPPIRILLDQNAPVGLRRAFRDFEVAHADDLGWSRLENGALIQAAEQAGFTVLITCDRNIRYQQNLAARRIALIELTVGAWPAVRNHLADVRAAIEAAEPGSYFVVPIRPLPKRRRIYSGLPDG